MQFPAPSLANSQMEKERNKGNDDESVLPPVPADLARVTRARVRPANGARVSEYARPVPLPLMEFQVEIVA